MTKQSLFPLLAMAALSTSVAAAEPNWLNNDAHPSYRHAKAACTPIDDNLYAARLVAETIAKGAISQKLGGRVTATSTLVKNNVETASDSEQSEQLIERIELKSSHVLPELSMIESGQFHFDGTDHFCVWVGALTTR